MARLKFLQGNYSNLNSAPISEGQVLVCDDTGEMFVDFASDRRVKIGNFTTVANFAALEAIDASSVPSSRLYYIEDGNILARSNGTTWVYVNKQKTADELKAILGLGNIAYINEVAETHLATALVEKLLPVVSTGDNGKILSVVNGAWTVVELTVVYVGAAQPANDLGNDGDLYLQTD